MILKDKVVIVSGIGPGLGQELAINAGREGAKARRSFSPRAHKRSSTK